MAFSVIIPSKNADNLFPCVQAIRDAKETCRIFVVDDGLTRMPDGCEYVEGADPFVFARNINLGITAAGTDDVILLNDDALLQTEGGFTDLARMANENRDFGLMSPATNNVGNLNQNYQGYPIIRYEKRMLCFVCIYIRREVIDRVGLLDERFHGYGYDDDDYSIRVRDEGYALGVWDGVRVDHKTLHSTFRTGEYPTQAFERNRLAFEAKWGASNHSL